MAIPVFLSQVVAATTDTVQVGGGSIQTLPSTYYYFLASPSQGASNGCCLLYRLTTLLGSSSAVTWTISFDANMHLKFVHNAGAPTNLILNRGLAWNLGFAKVTFTGYPVDLTQTITLSVPAGAGGYTAECRSPWIWCPDMGVSDTFPSLFDPSNSSGIRSAAGSASRAPDMTASFTKNGEQTEAGFVFTGVQGMYLARQPDLNAQSPYRERDDFETWWSLGPSLGRRFLFWRNSAELVGHGSDSLGASASARPRAAGYVEYYPSDALRKMPDIQPLTPDNPYLWNVRVGCWLTEHGTNVLYIDGSLGY